MRFITFLRARWNEARGDAAMRRSELHLKRAEAFYARAANFFLPLGLHK